MGDIRFLVLLISSFCIQWSISQEESVSHIFSGKCEIPEYGAVLNFSNVGFTRISDYLINSPHVSGLSLSKNNIREVSDKAFDLLPNLLYLDVSKNNIQKEALFCVGAGTNITTLVLDNNPRERYHEYYDSEIVIRNCILGYPNLKHVYARRCKLYSNEIPYFGAPNLTHLYLSFNNIDSLDPLHPLLPNVTHLYLDQNKIVKSRLNQMESLVVLDLSFNQIQYLCGEFCNDIGLSFSGTTNLQYLSLAGNKIANIEVDTFDNMINLRVLDLSNNAIIGLKKGTFESLNSLQNLSLSQNHLTTVPELYSLWNLMNLNLSFNNIETISSMRTAQDLDLQSLDLSNNKIYFIADDTFFNLTSLVHLDLSKNKLQTVSQNCIASLSKLKILHIGGNHIESFTNLYFSGATALTDVFLEENFITVFKADDMSNIPPNVSLHFIPQFYDPEHNHQCNSK